MLLTNGMLRETTQAVWYMATDNPRCRALDRRGRTPSNAVASLCNAFPAAADSALVKGQPSSRERGGKPKGAKPR
jgi:hypothetical protein